MIGYTVQEANQAKTTKIIVSLSVAGGMIYGLYKKKNFWGVTGFALMFGVAGGFLASGLNSIFERN